MKYKVIDLTTGYTVADGLNSREAANKIADKKNIQYGAHRYTVVSRQPTIEECFR